MTCVFGLPGSNNDLNVLDRSPLIHNMLTSKAHDMQFEVNGCQYDRYYLLTDGIYLSGFALCRASISPRMSDTAILQKDKRPCARMLRDVLVCCRPVSR